mmetsp:Transcript_23201/g.68164  ORF Transcript_23201/g.68164 Transcript_23201/m.68164 type:complete len:284 (+) Transcript_23201:153-1004(+)
MQVCIPPSAPLPRYTPPVRSGCKVRVPERMFYATARASRRDPASCWRRIGDTLLERVHNRREARCQLHGGEGSVASAGFARGADLVEDRLRGLQRTVSLSDRAADDEAARARLHGHLGRHHALLVTRRAAGGPDAWHDQEEVGPERCADRLNLARRAHDTVDARGLGECRQPDDLLLSRRAHPHGRQIRVVHARQHGHREHLWPLNAERRRRLCGRLDGCLHHRLPSARMDGEKRWGERRNRPHSARYRIRYVMELEVEEQGHAGRGGLHGLDACRAAGAEEF